MKKKIENNSYRLKDSDVARILPRHILESDLLKDFEKRLLAAIIWLKMNSPMAQKSGYLICTNVKLRDVADFPSDESFMMAISTLEMYGLIDRIKKGERDAPAYFVSRYNIRKSLRMIVPFDSLEDYRKRRMEVYKLLFDPKCEIKSYADLKVILAEDSRKKKDEKANMSSNEDVTYLHVKENNTVA